VTVSTVVLRFFGQVANVSSGSAERTNLADDDRVGAWSLDFVELRDSSSLLESIKDDLDRDKALGRVPRGLKRPLLAVGLFSWKLSVSVSEPARLSTFPDSSTFARLDAAG
jgi:hypothetical protein